MENGSTDAEGVAYTAFLGTRRVASGEPRQVALAAKRAAEADPWAPLLVFDDATGGRVELDLRGTDEEVLARFGPVDAAPEARPGPGRPKLGVVPREVTLLPRHWEWLNRQPGGASVALRKLVEEARKASAAKDRVRHSQEAAYRFLSAIAGDLPGFEEASRALFAGNGDRFDALTGTWPADIRDYARGLATAAFEKETE